MCVRKFPSGLQGGQDPRAGPGMHVQVAQAGVVPWMHPLLTGQEALLWPYLYFSMPIYTKKDNLQIEK